MTVADMERIIIAYEPVWAIGTGKTATPEQAQEMHGIYSSDVGRNARSSAAVEATRILYGGSVKPDNIAALMAQTDIDGALVGGASLEAESFAKIVITSSLRGLKFWYIRSYYILFFLSCVVLIASVLLQPGKTDAGALFTSNVSSTAFGPRGTASVLSKITIGAAITFHAVGSDARDAGSKRKHFGPVCNLTRYRDDHVPDPGS